MEDKMLFKNIWRFNAVIIAIAGILGIIVLLFSGYLIYKETTRDRYKREIVNVDTETNIEEKFRLGHLQHIKGFMSVIVPLYSDQSFSLNYSGSKSTTSTRNILFSDLNNETNKWLLPHNKFLITKYKLINESNSYSSDENIITILYKIVKNDTNNDSRLTESDKLIISLSEPNGNNYTEVLKNIDSVIGYELINKEVIAILYSRENQGFTAYIDLNGFKVKKEIKLPKFN